MTRRPRVASLGLQIPGWLLLLYLVVCLAAVVDARGARDWSLPGETGYWIVLPLVALWGVVGLRILLRSAPAQAGSA